MVANSRLAAPVLLSALVSLAAVRALAETRGQPSDPAPCVKAFERARIEAAKSEHVFAKAKVESELDTYSGESTVRLQSSLSSSCAFQVIAVRRGDRGGTDDPEWQHFEETPGGKDQVVWQRNTTNGHGVVILACFKQPTTDRLAGVFKVAVDECLR